MIDTQLLDKLSTSLRSCFRATKTNKQKQQSLILDIIAVSSGLRPAVCLDVTVSNPSDLANTLAQDCPQLCLLHVTQQMQTFVVHRVLTLQVLQELASNKSPAICIDAFSDPPVVLVRFFSLCCEHFYLDIALFF